MTDPNESEMHLLPEPLFSLANDNTYILTIVGTENGRIFLGGKDGCLYELAYQVRKELEMKKIGAYPQLTEWICDILDRLKKDGLLADVVKLTIQRAAYHF